MLTGKTGRMKFRPLHDRVVIRPFEGEDKTKGGILIPTPSRESRKRRSHRRRVPGARDETASSSPSRSKPAIACVGKWSGSEVKIDAERSLIMKEIRHPRVIELATTPRRAPERRARLSNHWNKTMSAKTSDSPPTHAEAHAARRRNSQ